MLAMPSSLDVFSEHDYRTILKREFETRKLRRPAYSIRAFARDIGVSGSRLCAVMSGRYGLSASTAKLISSKLHYTTQQTSYFVDLVESKHSRTKLGREQALKRVKAISVPEVFEQISESQSDILGKWFYAAVLEIISSQNIFEPTKIARHLRLSIDEVNEGIQVLLRLGVLKKVGKKFEAQNEFLIANGSRSKSIFKKFHNEVLDQVKIAIIEKPLESRKNISTIFSLDCDRLDSARDWLDQMHKQFIKEFGAKGSHNAVMALGVHLIPVSDGVADD